jgi:hypothetical protein
MMINNDCYQKFSFQRMLISGKHHSVFDVIISMNAFYNLFR